MEFKIYTKTGDRGETSLIGGRRVPKYDIQIEAYGTVDELNSFIGLIHDECGDAHVRSVMLEIMDRLFTLESLLADDKSPDPEGTRRPRTLPQLSESDILFLEKEIDAMNDHLPSLSSFILPGGHRLGSYCHIARTVCRRAERVTLQLGQEIPVEPLAVKYLNRLSDFLFVLARKLVLDNGGEEIPWKARI